MQNERTYNRPMGLLNALLALTLITAAALLIVAIYPYAVKQIKLPVLPTEASLRSDPRKPPSGISHSDAPLSPVQLQDPAQNGGNTAPTGCQFPVVNGACANGGTPNENVAPVEMAKPIVEQAPVIIAPIATVEPNAIAQPALGQCLHGQIFTDQGCKNPDAHEKAKP